MVSRLTKELERSCRLAVSQVPTLEAIRTGKVTAGSTPPIRGQGSLTLKTAGTRLRQFHRPSSAPNRAARPSGQTRVSTATKTASTSPPVTQPRTHSAQLAHFVRQVITVTARAVAITRKAIRRAMSAWQGIDLVARHHGNRLVTALYLFAMMTLPTLVPSALYYLTGNATAAAVIFLVSAGTVAILYAYCVDRY